MYCLGFPFDAGAPDRLYHSSALTNLIILFSNHSAVKRDQIIFTPNSIFLTKTIVRYGHLIYDKSTYNYSLLTLWALQETNVVQIVGTIQIIFLNQTNRYYLAQLKLQFSQAGKNKLQSS